MSRPMRNVAAVMLVLMGVFAAWMTLQQTLAGASYRNDPRNARALPDPADTTRGPITSADGVVLAEDRDGIRFYARGPDYLHLVGYVAGEHSAGLEQTRAGDLSSLDDGSITSWLIRLFGGSVEPPEVRLTVVDALQQAAIDGLGGRTGAVVALDPRTGAVLAYAASPTADPNDLADGSVSPTVHVQQPEALDRVAFRLLPPGSTFKVLVAAAALEQGLSTESALDDVAEYLAPGAGVPITNITGSTCSGGDQLTLREAVAVSCNTAFAALAVELGAEVIVEIAERAGLNDVLPFELGAAISSVSPVEDLEGTEGAGALAQTGIGERDTRVTPLQMAVITAALGNGGEMMTPYVVDGVVSRDGTFLNRTGSSSAGRLVAPDVAADLVSMMTDVVATGTGRAAAIPGIAVAGKTGTAEGAGGPHAWFVALAPAEDPTIAIVVVVEGQGTGGTTAAPIAARVLAEWFGA